jgi:hypothetical protein
MKVRLEMMKRHIGFFGVLAAMAITPMAHANYLIAYVINGAPSASTTCLNNPVSTNLSGSPTSCNVVVGGVTLGNLTGNSNSPGTTGLADEFSSSGELSNGSAGEVTVNIWYAAQGFAMPVTGGSVTGINFASNSSGTSVNVAAPSSSTVQLESCIDEVAAGGVGTNFCASPAKTLTNAKLQYPAGLGGVVDNTLNTTFSPLTATYTLEQEITIVLDPGDSVNYSMSQALTPVPEPLSVGLLGGVLLLTGRALQRKRKQSVSS